ncbi:hypothetical protein [Streptomyces sp. NPDC057403]|uniref:hypothetical protein n=1 Tax=Streptomyces sp. NPDC057403 TaxID=3346119 RepID=UPI0036C67591
MSLSPVRVPTARHALRAGLATVAATAVLGALGGCSAGSAGTASSAPTTPPPSTSASAGHSVVLEEQARGTTVRVTAGTHLLVRLHSTYWSTPAGSNPQVLDAVGGGTTTAGTCPPGRGCGLSSARFTALRPGTAHITARRHSCGEAMRCSPGQERYDVTVTVTR